MPRSAVCLLGPSPVLGIKKRTEFRMVTCIKSNVDEETVYFKGMLGIASNPDSLDFIKGDLIIAAIIKACRPC